MTAVFNSSSSSLSLNGTSVNGLNPGTSNLSSGIRIGAHKDISDFLKGSIAEFFILDGTNANTRAKAEGYLAHKWGLAATLPNSHPYKINQALTWNTSLQSAVSVEANAANLGSGKEGFYGTTISGLTAGETYHYRIRSLGKLNPKGVSGSNLKLWLDASELSTTDPNWADHSGNGNDGITGGSPSVVTNAQNGLSVMHYTGNGQRHKFNMINDIRTVFWVLSIDQAYSTSGFRYVLSDSTKHPHWHNNNNGKLFGGYSNTHVQNASTRLNGASVNGSNTNQPTSLSILSVKTTGNVDADNFGYDRTHTSRQWRGRLGELIIYNSALSDGDIAKVEGYLAHKWGLTETLPAIMHTNPPYLLLK
jgi:hypothetical protein